MITQNSTVKYWDKIKPFTPLNVTIRAFTYWATAPQIRAEIFSPPSTPSAPVNLRSFILIKDLKNTFVVRWDPPIYPNGVLQDYKLRCWQKNDDDLENDVFNEKIGSNRTEFILKNLNNDEIYYVEVSSFNH